MHQQTTSPNGPDPRQMPGGGLGTPPVMEVWWSAATAGRPLAEVCAQSLTKTQPAVVSSFCMSTDG
jgi:hypothetical protein